jgi:hypothetical protein
MPSKQLRTKTVDIAVVKRGSIMAFCEKVKRSANEKIVFGNAWELQILAAIIGGPSASGQRLEKKQGPSASQKSSRKTNQDESVTSLAMATLAAHA